MCGGGGGCSSWDSLSGAQHIRSSLHLKPNHCVWPMCGNETGQNQHKRWCEQVEGAVLTIAQVMSVVPQRWAYRRAIGLSSMLQVKSMPRTLDVLRRHVSNPSPNKTVVVPFELPKCTTSKRSSPRARPQGSLDRANYRINSTNDLFCLGGGAAPVSPARRSTDQYRDPHNNTRTRRPPSYTG